METPSAQKPFFRRAALALLVIAFVFAALLVTPQGRALAQSILQFFTRAGSDTLPAPTPQPLGWVAQTPGGPQPTLIPTTSPTPAAGSTPLVDCGKLPDPKCSVEQVRSQVNFTVKELGSIPSGMYFIGAVNGPQGVELLYDTPDHSGFIYLSQAPWTGGPEQTGGLVAPAAAVESVSVNSLPAEYVKGSYNMNDGDTTATWKGDMDSQSLHWVDQGVFVRLESQGQAFPVDRERFIALAEGLTTEAVSAFAPVLVPTPDAFLLHLQETYPLTVSQAAQQSGFAVKEPGKLPDVLSLAGAAYEAGPGVVHLFYMLDQNRVGPNTDGLTLNEERIPSGADCELCNFVPGDNTALGTADHPGKYYDGTLVGTNASLETVQIGTASGQYVEGDWQGTDCCGWKWVTDPLLKRLRWQANGMAFELTYFGEELTRADLLAIAESIK